MVMAQGKRWAQARFSLVLALGPARPFPPARRFWPDRTFLTTGNCFLGFMCLLAFVGAPPVSAVKGDPPAGHTLGEYIGAIRVAESAAQRFRLYFELWQGVRTQRIDVGTAAEAESLAALHAELIRFGDHGVTSLALEQLAAHPHPVAIPALRAIVDTTATHHFRMQALDALVSLRDSAVLPVLLNDLNGPVDRGRRRVLQLLGQLGDPQALPAVKRLAHHPNLADEYLSQPEADTTGLSSRDTRSLLHSIRRHAEEDRAAARHAARLLRAAEAGQSVVCAFELDEFVFDHLLKNGFVLSPVTSNEMYDLYSPEYPYVTTDIVFHTFMILARAYILETEQLLLRPAALDFVDAMAAACLEQADASDSRAERDRCFANAAFFSVPLLLLTDDAACLDGLSDGWGAKVRSVVERIQKHSEIDDSVLFGYLDDYTHYEPRGAYAALPEQGRYFQAMAYLGRMFFRLDSPDETLRAIALTELIGSRPELMAQWRRIDELLGMLFGEPDDLCFDDYSQALAARSPRQGLNGLIQVLARQPSPRINTAFLRWPQSMQWKSRTRGLRIFGQRYTRDIDLVQQLLDAEVWPPSGLHVAAGLLGSDRARELLPAETGDAVLEALEIPSRAQDPLQSFADGWLHCHRPLFQPAPGRPEFMGTDLWEERLIGTALGAWAEVRHATMLYTKDAHHYLCVSLPTDRFHGYVDPYPRFFARLDGLVERLLAIADRAGLFERIAEDCDRIRRGHAERLGIPVDSLESRTALKGVHHSDRYQVKEDRMRLSREDLESFRRILSRLESIACKELAGTPQSVRDGFFLKGLGHQFKHLAFNRSNSDRAKQSMAFISEAATEYLHREVWQVGAGKPLTLFAAIPDGDRRVVCRGAVYSYTEFQHPIGDRLTDEEWKPRADYPRTPEPAPWLANRPGLGLQRTLTRAELERLRGCQDYPGGVHIYSRNRVPWEISPLMDAARDIGSAGVAAEDLDLLLELAAQDVLNVGVRAWAFRQLNAHGQDPRVCPFLKEQAEQMLARPEGLDQDAHVRLHQIIHGLATCDTEAARTIGRIERRLAETYNGDFSDPAARVLVVYHRLVEGVLGWMQ